MVSSIVFCFVLLCSCILFFYSLSKEAGIILNDKQRLGKRKGNKVTLFAAYYQMFTQCSIGTKRSKEYDSRKVYYKGEYFATEKPPNILRENSLLAHAFPISFYTRPENFEKGHTTIIQQNFCRQKPIVHRDAKQLEFFGKGTKIVGFVEVEGQTKPRSN